MLAATEHGPAELPTPEDVLSRCGLWIRRTAVRLRDRMPWAEIDDLVQQGIMTALEMRERYHPDRGVPFEAFIKPRVFGAMVDMVRRNGAMIRREGDLANHIEPPTDPDAIEILIATENLLSLTDAIDTLPDQERTVISLYYLEEFTNAEIARVLDLSEPTATRLRQKAISALAKYIVENKNSHTRPATRPANAETGS